MRHRVLLSPGASGGVFHMTNKLKREYQERLGEKLGAVFHDLLDDWAQALARLQEYRALFGDPARIEFLNTISGGAFMSDVQHLFWENLLLYVTRLTDQAEEGRKLYLTVLCLPAYCDDPALRARVQALAKTAHGAAESARKWRNKRIAHSDLSRAIDPDAEPLAPATLESVDSVLDAVPLLSH